jgi:hypothetical protein
LADCAFLASVNKTLSLQNQLLYRIVYKLQDSHYNDTLSDWSIIHLPTPPPVDRLASIQRSWDQISIDKTFSSLLASQPTEYDKARLISATAAHSGDWLHALPLSSCGLRLDNEAIRVAVGLRLGANLCDSHTCRCGTLVNCRGSHGLSCKRGSGKIARHNLINDIIFHALSSAGIPSTKEPIGLLRTDGKRPDGLTLVP